MSKIHHLLRLVSKHKFWFIGGGVVAVSGVLLFSFGGAGVVETVSTRTEDLVRTVKISGKVIPSEKVDLAFEIGGTVSSVGKPVGSKVYKGEVLARLNSGPISADVLKSEAELASAQAELAKLEGTAVYENSINNAKRSVNQSIRDAYTAASDAIQNKADQVFIDPLSSHPVIRGFFDSYNDLRESVNNERVSIGYMLESWHQMVVSLGSSTYTDSELNLSKEYLSRTIAFITDVSSAVNMFEVTSYMSQSDIDSYKASMLSARESLNQVSQGFITSENTLSQSLSDVPVQVARVEAAKASVLNLKYQLAKTALTSPMTGVVAKQDAKLGQAVSAGVQIVSIISGDYLIETYVPEVLIAGIKVGNTAHVTLDAYGAKESFETKVERIDPAETIKDGVSTYKVELSFVSLDERIRSGMTANIEIETFRKVSATLLPERAVVREGEESFVYVVDTSSKKRKIQVEVGEKDSKGNIEILSGLSTNDQVVVNP